MYGATRGLKRFRGTTRGRTVAAAIVPTAVAGLGGGACGQRRCGSMERCGCLDWAHELGPGKWGQVDLGRRVWSPPQAPVQFKRPKMALTKR